MPVALGLGGNVGDVRARVVEALVELTTFLSPGGDSERPTSTLRISPLFRTTPVSAIPQPDFLNAAALATTWRTPREILDFAQRLEQRAGRRPAPRDAPRPLDVDLLVHGDSVLDQPGLTLPHPRLGERAFVLVPLAVIAPELPVPPSGTRVGELLARLGEVSGVERVAWGEEAARRLALDPAVDAGLGTGSG